MKTFMIRKLEQPDLGQLISTFCFPWSTLEATNAYWKKVYDEQKKNIRFVAIIEKENQLIGYGSLLR